MSTRTRRGGLVALILVLVASASFWSAPSAQADVILPITWNINATTHIKSVNMDVVVPQGTFTGEINLTTGDLTGNIALPPAVQEIKFFGIKLASATFAMSPAAPITGKVNLATFEVTVNASYNFKITKATLALLPRLNLIDPRCTGVTPVTVSMAGKVDLSGAPQAFSSEYTIPKFKNCGLLVTPLLNLIIPGPGNTFSATFAPPPAPGAPVTP
jgi:hypothetical protein